MGAEAAHFFLCSGDSIRSPRPHRKNTHSSSSIHHPRDWDRASIVLNNHKLIGGCSQGASHSSLAASLNSFIVHPASVSFAHRSLRVHCAEEGYESLPRKPDFRASRASGEWDCKICGPRIYPGNNLWAVCPLCTIPSLHLAHYRMKAEFIVCIINPTLRAKIHKNSNF